MCRCMAFCFRSLELFVGQSVWWFLFEGDKLGNFCECFDVERPRPASDYWDYYDVDLYGAVGRRFVGLV